VVYLLALLSAEHRGALPKEALTTRLQELENLSDLVAMQLAAWEQDVRAIAAEYKHARSFLFLGRGLHYPIAREGALKLKESAYLHAEGYPAGELKHGPNALVGDSTPLVMIATRDRRDRDSVLRYERMLQLLVDMRVQGANVLAVANEGDEEVARLATRTVFVKETREALLAICEVIPLQMFSYFMATQNGIDVDSPRNLSKAVLVE
jgi:glucosamine--fructose-6-phosphate aminotransferase (isomerizing)